AGLVQRRVSSPEAFAGLKTAYKTWAIAQAAADWTGDELPVLDGLLEHAELPAARACLTDQQRARQSLTRLMHRIDFEDDQAILIETPTLHAIAGLSLQIHPKTPG